MHVRLLGMKKVFKVSIVLVVFYAVYCLGFTKGQQYFTTSHNIPSSVTKPVIQDAKLLKQAKALGIDVSAINLKNVSKPKTEGLSNVVGAFIPPNTIEIKKGLSSKEVRVTLAHEYMHYVWTQLTTANRNALIKIYSEMKSTWLKQRLSAYHDCDKTCLANESNAYVCTELHPDTLTREFNSYCDELIPRRNLLF